MPYEDYHNLVVTLRRYRELGIGNHRSPPSDRPCIDKGTILKKRGLITDGFNDIKSVIGEADRVRNSCARTDPEKDFGHLLLDRASLQGFITSAEDMIAATRT